MTSQGHAYARFQRAIKTGNAYLAMAAARELRHVDLADAVSLCLLLRDDDPLRFEPAAVRWVARVLASDSALRLADARELVELLAWRRTGRPSRQAQTRAMAPPARP